MGGLAGVAAIMLTLENKNYFGNQGQGYLLTAIASVLIGGTSIFGGRATIVGTVFGCFIIGMIEAGLVADRPDRRLGAHGSGPRLPDRRSSSISMSTSRSGARASRALAGLQEFGRRVRPNSGSEPRSAMQTGGRN